MPTLEQVKSTLWPKAPYTPWLVKGAVARANEAYGPGLDVGAIKSHSNKTVLVLTPAGWAQYNEKEHLFIANVFNRVGMGWSFGSNSIHNQARAWFEIVHGRKPDEMENVDIQFNRTLFESLKQQAIGKERPTDPIKPPVNPPSDTKPTPTPTPTPIPVIRSNTLSPLSIRVEELRSILLSIPNINQSHPLTNQASWPIIKPIAVEILRTYRLLRRSLGDTRELPKE